jgi:hypothetical protein
MNKVAVLINMLSYNILFKTFSHKFMRYLVMKGPQ